ncbi:MAG: hypothetical protein QOI05_3820 [Bradyrhizobium sp.]|jgi:hypothetical protein|nr:hypothetical protein [Bradyrhizobium sp.]
MKVILFGATEMVGQGALRECASKQGLISGNPATSFQGL